MDAADEIELSTRVTEASSTGPSRPPTSNPSTHHELGAGSRHQLEHEASLMPETNLSVDDSRISQPGSAEDATDTGSEERAGVTQTFQPLSKLATFRLWYLEVLALLVSIASFAAIIALLSAFDEKPQPELTYININTLVAIFTTILRAALVFVLAEGKMKNCWLKSIHFAGC